MDRDLVTRVALSCVFVFAFLVSSQAGFHVSIVAPLAVLGVAVVMFWPRHSEDPEPESHTDMDMEMEDVK